jgi:glycerol kinase
MEGDSGAKLRALKVDGGMVFNETLMQFQSDILGVPVVRPTVTETSALGAAYAAGLAVGLWDSLGHLCENWGIDKVWEPTMDPQTRDELHRSWLKAVERSFHWVD